MFEVGEIVDFVWTDNPDDRKFIGCECTITGTTDDRVEGYKVYIVDLDGGKCASTKCLRKRKPPEEDIEEIDWVKMCNLDKLPEIA